MFISLHESFVGLVYDTVKWWTINKYDQIMADEFSSLEKKKLRVKSWNQASLALKGIQLESTAVVDRQPMKLNHFDSQPGTPPLFILEG